MAVGGGVGEPVEVAQTLVNGITRGGVLCQRRQVHTTVVVRALHMRVYGEERERERAGRAQ